MIIFNAGPGGCGKTYLYNSLIAQLKSEKKGAVACASTGIAALLLIGRYFNLVLKIRNYHRRYDST